MERADWLMIASAVVWVALGLYIFTLSRKQATLEKRLAQIELLEKD